MKSTEYVLIATILADVGMMCNTSMDRDAETIASRLDTEGLSFLTITLPSFAKAFETGLELGFIDPSLFPAFSKEKKKSSGRIPRFLSGIVSMVFEPGDGTLRETPSIEAIDAVRQICYTYQKLEKECTYARKAKALLAYKSCEEDLRAVRFSAWQYQNDYTDIARVLFGGVFFQLQEILCAGGLVPKHGPGAVVEKLSGNAKYRHRSWTKRLARTMPPDNYVFSNSEAWIDGDRYLEILSKKDEEPVKVIFVPKTQKTPRVIAVEPAHMQYAQQAIMLPLVQLIEKDNNLKGRINFSDSTVNRSLAREASISRNFATLDMSEASDRVHASLAFGLFRNYPELLQAIFACRSSKAKLPTGEIIHLKKFASMGSALCFPVESMVFFTLCVLAGLRVRGLRVTARNILDVTSKITVYGDDLIIPTAWREMCSNLLESVGLRVNQSKSFSRGFFRESCGLDSYKGHNVTPVRLRSSAPTTRRDASEFASWAATSNLFYNKGYWKTALCMRIILEDIFGPLPHVGRNSPAVGWKSFQDYYSIERWNIKLSRFEIHGITLESKTKKDLLEGYDRLFKFHLLGAQQDIAAALEGGCDFTRRTRGYVPVTMDKEHNEHSTLRGSVYTKSRWTTPH